MAKSEEWIYRLSADDIAELDEALAHVRRRGLDTLDVARADFPLPRLGAVLDGIHRELLEGRGIVLIRGLPVRRYSMADTATVYWGLGTHFGQALSQNAKGHVLGHVRDLGYDHRDPHVRVYQTTERQYFHTDSCDLVGLLCLRQARSGGLSAIISSVTVFNEMRARHPDLVPVLFEPFETDRRGEVPEGMEPWFAVPVFNWHAGRLSTMYVRRYRVGPTLPRGAASHAAPDRGPRVFDSLLEDRALNLFTDFEPGDIQLLHNHQILHDRTGDVDWPEPERKRHLLRLWLAPSDGRPLPECYVPRYGSVEIGRRGGILVPGTTLTVPLQPV